MTGQGAAPAGGEKRTPSLPGGAGTRPPALRPAAGSSADGRFAAVLSTIAASFRGRRRQGEGGGRKRGPASSNAAGGAPAGVSSPIARGGGDVREVSHGRPIARPPGTRSQGARVYRRSAPLTFRGSGIWTPA